MPVICKDCTSTGMLKDGGKYYGVTDYGVDISLSFVSRISRLITGAGTLMLGSNAQILR